MRFRAAGENAGMLAKRTSLSLAPKPQRVSARERGRQESLGIPDSRNRNLVTFEAGIGVTADLHLLASPVAVLCLPDSKTGATLVALGALPALPQATEGSVANCTDV